MSFTDATTDGLATLHIDHDSEVLHVDVHQDATGKTQQEIDLLCQRQGLFMVDGDECPPEYLTDKIRRYYLAYLEEPTE